MPLFNLAWKKEFFWDGRAATLEQQVLQPIQDPNEMDMTLPEVSARVGMPIEFSVNGYPGRTFSGRITRVSPVADPTTRQVKITAAIPNAGNI